MTWKNLLYSMLAVLLPLLYSLLLGKYPDFPLNQGETVALLLWLIGLLVGGWNLKAFFSQTYDYRRK